MANEVNYFEIGSADAAASKAFYEGLFGWQVGEPSMPARYSMVNGGKGGLWDTSAMGTEMGVANWAIFYVQVDDVTQTIARARQLGAEVVIPMIDNGQIEFAHLTDPSGNRFGIWRPKD